MTHAQIKARSQSFSLTREEMASVLAGVKRHRFRNRNEYLLALVEADESIPLEPTLDKNHRKVLRPTGPQAALQQITEKLSARARQSAA